MQSNLTIAETNRHAQLIDSLLKDMIFIPAGSFMQGSDMKEVQECVLEWGNQLVEEHFTKELFTQWILKEYPAFRVQLDSFFIGKFPVTNSQYEAYVSLTGEPLPKSIQLKSPGDHPVWGLTVKDICRFVSWLKDQTQLDFRLPSESEWEYAARGPENRKYPFGNVFNHDCCNTVESGIKNTTPVNRYEHYASGFGLCDMAGNVEEFTSGFYMPYPNGKTVVDDLLIALGEHYPVTKGGSFHRGGDLARCARRHGPFPSEDYQYIGFRLAINNLN